NGEAVYGYVFTFIDTTKAAFSDVSIPYNLTTGLFNSKLLDLRFDGSVPGVDIINFNATSFEINPGSAVPEPSTYAAWAGLAVFGTVLWRRRRV
ncbi:MAG: PEP-CTERM sorting domain-containing protein, partial [Cephaloticoccus sp.]|nr:PEP-CTERM sorting domain-containing protein [Cephaloticoccus sp.]